jgi:arginase
MFLVVPQWQGSGSSRSMRLVDGANAILGDLPSSSTKTVEIPLEAGDERGSGVARCGSLLLVRERMHHELRAATGPVITIGGDCGVELAAIEHVLDSDVAVVWFDAHPDLNTPESSPSGAFHGMVLRSLLGDGAADLLPSTPLAPDRLILAGTRACDPAEDDYLSSSGLRCIEVEDLDADSLIGAIEETGATSVYLHIDLDVLDPGDFVGLGYPEPFGVSGSALVELIRAIKSRFPLAGAGITEFAPSSIDEAVEDLPTVLRIIGALSS